MRITITLLGLALVAFCGRVAAGDEPPVPTASPEDEKAIRGQIAAFVRAYNKGDAPALAKLFTNEAIVTDQEGHGTEGRPAIARLFADVFAANPGSTITVKTTALKFISPEFAEEEGQTTVVPAGGGDPETGRYVVLYVKQNGAWLQARVRELIPKEPTTQEHLKPLEWMVGDWVSESAAGVVLTSCKWAEGQNFLQRTFVLNIKGRPAVTGTQMIGWDPLTRHIKSWTFDSHGNVAEGSWSRRGNEWVIKSSGVLRDGQTASATQVVTHEAQDRARWRTVDRTLDARVIDDVDEIILVRRPPAPRQAVAPLPPQVLVPVPQPPAPR